MQIQLLYIHQLGVYYKVTNALVLTQWLYTHNYTVTQKTRPDYIFKWLQQSFYSDTSHETAPDWSLDWSGLQQTIVNETIDVSRPVSE